MTRTRLTGNPSFRMNDYQVPIDIREDVTVYSLGRTNIVRGTLAFCIFVGVRTVAEVYSGTDICYLTCLDDSDVHPTFASCNWRMGGIYVGWNGASIPDHEICCSYEYMRTRDTIHNDYIEEAVPVTVNWLKEGF